MRRLTGWKLWLLIAVTTVLYSAGLVYLFRRYPLPPLSVLGGFLVGASVIAQFAAKWAFGLLFRDGIIAGGRNLSVADSFRAALVGAGVARLIPAGGAITPVAMSWTVRKEVTGTAGAALRATVLNYAGLLIGTGYCLLWIRGRGLPGAAQAGIVITGIVAFLIGVVLMLGSGWIGSMGRWLPAKLRQKLGPSLSNHPPRWPAQRHLWTRLLLEAAAMYAVMEAFSVHLTPTQAFAAFGISQLAGGLPGTPGGLGFTEAGLVGALSAFGFAAQTTVGPVLVYRLVSYWLVALASMVVGGATFLRREAGTAATNGVIGG